MSRTRAAASRAHGRKARERARRYADVLLAARRLYARKGYQQTAMVEIARASELAVGTLYQLFPSKEAILRGLLEERMDDLITRVRAAVDGERDVREQLRRVVETHLTFARDNADILRLYLSGWIGYDTRTRQRFGDRIDARYERYLAVLTAVFKRGVDTGALAPRPPRRLAVTLAGLIHAVIRRGLRERRLDFTAEGDALLDILLHGVLADGSAREPSR
jgi:TetR/AcrR family transcriptional regulator, cholesterol catabolism regulator